MFSCRKFDVLSSNLKKNELRMEKTWWVFLSLVWQFLSWFLVCAWTLFVARKSTKFSTFLHMKASPWPTTVTKLFFFFPSATLPCFFYLFFRHHRCSWRVCRGQKILTYCLEEVLQTAHLNLSIYFYFGALVVILFWLTYSGFTCKNLRIRCQWIRLLTDLGDELSPVGLYVALKLWNYILKLSRSCNGGLYFAAYWIHFSLTHV